MLDSEGVCCRRSLKLHQEGEVSNWGASQGLGSQGLGTRALRMRRVTFPSINRVQYFIPHTSHPSYMEL